MTNLGHIRMRVTGGTDLNQCGRCFWKIALISLVLPVGALQAQTVGTMTEVVENVRTNEGLYANLEVRLRSTYRLGKYDNPLANYAKSSERSARFVYQDGMFYFRNDEEMKDLKGGIQRPDVLEGFDGKTTRLLEQHVIANIRDGRMVETRLLRPFFSTKWKRTGRPGQPYQARARLRFRNTCEGHAHTCEGHADQVRADVPKVPRILGDQSYFNFSSLYLQKGVGLVLMTNRQRSGMSDPLQEIPTGIIASRFRATRISTIGNGSLPSCKRGGS